MEKKAFHVGADAHAVVLDEPREDDRIEPRVVAARVLPGLEVEDDDDLARYSRIFAWVALSANSVPA